MCINILHLLIPSLMILLLKSLVILDYWRKQLSEYLLDLTTMDDITFVLVDETQFISKQVLLRVFEFVDVLLIAFHSGDFTSEVVTVNDDAKLSIILVFLKVCLKKG